MFDYNTINKFKKQIIAANARRDTVRQQHYTVSYDNLISSGNSLYYACLRLVALVPKLRTLDKNFDAAYKEYNKELLHDYKTIKKSILIPSDQKLRIHYYKLMNVVHKKLK